MPRRHAQRDGFAPTSLWLCVSAANCTKCMFGTKPTTTDSLLSDFCALLVRGLSVHVVGTHAAS